MSVFSRSDSQYWWLFLETTKTKERTEFKLGETAAQRRDSRRLAEDRYHQRMNELAARLYRLPSAQPSIRFDKYADTYAADTISHHKGAERELGLLKALRAFLGDDLLSAIDQDRVKSYLTDRRTKVTARTANREVDLLKAMLRDAAPKYLTASPLVGMKRLHVVPPKRRLMQPAEEAKLLEHATPTERALLILAVDGLVRLNDLLDVQRADRQRGWIYIRDPKSGQPYEVALTTRAAHALDAVPHDGPYYFQRYRGSKMDRDRRSRIRRVLKKLCAKAGVPYGKKIHGLTFHWATRRTGATRLLMKRKAPLPAVQRQGNWLTPDVLLGIYAEADRQDQRKAVGSFPARSRAKRKSA